jgi:hypothetical protein
LRWDIPTHYVHLGTTQEHQALREDRTGMLEKSVPAAIKEDDRLSLKLRHGVPWKVILDVADQDTTDLIVVNLQGKGKVERVSWAHTSEGPQASARRTAANMEMRTKRLKARKFTRSLYVDPRMNP